MLIRRPADTPQKVHQLLPQHQFPYCQLTPSYTGEIFAIPSCTSPKKDQDPLGSYSNFRRASISDIDHDRALRRELLSFAPTFDFDGRGSCMQRKRPPRIAFLPIYFNAITIGCLIPRWKICRPPLLPSQCAPPSDPSQQPIDRVRGRLAPPSTMRILLLGG